MQIVVALLEQVLAQLNVVLDFLHFMVFQSRVWLISLLFVFIHQMMLLHDNCVSPLNCLESCLCTAFNCIHIKQKRFELVNTCGASQVSLFDDRVAEQVNHLLTIYIFQLRLQLIQVEGQRLEGFLSFRLVHLKQFNRFYYLVEG